MKLHILSDVLFDEFPQDETIKYCLFTQPAYPVLDYSKRTNVKFYCTETAYHVMGCLKKSPMKMFEVINEQETNIDASLTFGVRCIPTGSPSGSVMLLINIGETIHLYTGQFTECREALMAPIVHDHKDMINDIHVDNTVASFRKFGFRQHACHQIEEIVNDNVGYTIYLHTELFGYEDLIFNLARNGIKIQLNKLQKILFEQNGHADLFKFDGLPQIKIYSRFSEVRPLELRDYKWLFDVEKIITIKLQLIQHEMHEVEKIKGLYIVPYTPHATSYDLFCLFQTIEPKRIYPLISKGFNYDPISDIPDDILNDNCEVIEIEDLKAFETKDSFLDLSEELTAISDSENVPSIEIISDCDEVEDDKLPGLHTEASSKKFKSNAEPEGNGGGHKKHTNDDDGECEQNTMTAQRSPNNRNEDECDDDDSDILIFPD